MDAKTNKTIIGIVLIIIGTILIADGIYFSVNYIQEKHQENKEAKYETTTEYFQEVEDAISYFDNNLADEYPIKNVDNLSPIKKTLLLLNISETIDQTNLLEKEVSEEVLTSKQKELFIKDFILYQGDIEINKQVLYKYDSENKVYKSDTIASKNYSVNNRVIEAKTSSDSKELLVKRKLYFVENTALSEEETSSGINIYKSVSDLENGKNSVYTTEGNNYTISDEIYEEIKDELSTYTYRFVRKGKIYKLKSVSVNE